MADELLLTIGGCAANAAVDLAKMGVSASVVGRVGDDVFGRIVTELLAGHGLDTSTILETANSATSQTLIVNVTGEDRRFIHCFGANATCFGPRIFPMDRVRQSRVLYLGGYLLMPNMTHDELIPVFKAARGGREDCTRCCHAGPGDYLPRLEPLFPHVDVFLPNDHEGQIITGESDPLRQAEVFRRLGARTVVITCGSRGSSSSTTPFGSAPALIRFPSWMAPEGETRLTRAIFAACWMDWMSKEGSGWPAHSAPVASAPLALRPAFSRVQNVKNS